MRAVTDKAGIKRSKVNTQEEILDQRGTSKKPKRLSKGDEGAYVVRCSVRSAGSEYSMEPGTYFSENLLPIEKSRSFELAR